MSFHIEVEICSTEIQMQNFLLIFSFCFQLKPGLVAFYLKVSFDSLSLVGTAQSERFIGVLISANRRLVSPGCLGVH